MSSPEEATLLTTLAVAVFLGMVAQLLAERFKLPAILPLLVLGIAAGSSYGLGWVEPSSLGHGLEVFIHLGVAIILFEGGLSLDLKQLARVGGAVRNLLTVGVVVTGLGAAALAHWASGISWSGAALFGAIVTVTGPTVIAPLLRHMVAPREVKTVLMSEGLIIDPIGAVLAYLVLQWIERAGVPVRELTSELLLLAATGAAVGFLAGSLARWLARSRLVGGELRNLGVLALLVMAYMVAESQAHQSGILMAVVMGMTMSGSEIPDLTSLKAFKGQLTTLFISLLFILLSAQLDLGAMAELGWGGAVVVAGVVLAVRPLAVALSIPVHETLGWKERAVLAMTAPRGIVAAAVASLAARQLQRSGVAGGPALEGLVYLVILATGAWATAMAVLLPRLLGYRDDPSRRLTVLVGASPLSAHLGRLLDERGVATVVIDWARSKLDGLREQGLRTHLADARNASAWEEVGAESDTVVLAMTPNDELNLLVADLVHDEFGVHHPVVVLQKPAEEFGTRRRAWMDLLGGRSLDLPRWTRALEGEKARFVTVDLTAEDAVEGVQAVLREFEKQLFPVCGWNASQPRFSHLAEELATLEEITLLVQEGEAAERLAALPRPPKAGRAKAAGAGGKKAPR